MSQTERIRALLEAIVQAYIRTAHPVGSKTIADELDFQVSPATIRNDMAVLEQAGYIMQPHTSAGRIPTEKGYQYYIQHFLHETQLNREQKQAIDKAFETDLTNATAQLKHLAKTIANLTNEVVVVSTPTHEYYITGIAHLFRKPEFAEADRMLSLTETFDHLEEVMHQVAIPRDQHMQVLIGKDNPISDACTVIVSAYAFDAQQRGLIAIIGPMRMHYDRNIAILHYMESVMES